MITQINVSNIEDNANSSIFIIADKNTIAKINTYVAQLNEIESQKKLLQEQKIQFFKKDSCN